MAVYTLEIKLEGIDALSPVLARAERSVDRAADGIRRSLSGVERSLQNVAQTGRRSMGSLGESMDRVGGRMRATGEKLRPVGLALGAVGAAIGGIFTVGVMKFASFEQAMANVKAVSGATGEEFAALEELAKSLGETTRFTAQEAAEGLRFMAMAGLDTQQMLAGLPKVLQLSAASGMELGESADILTNIMTAMGLEATDLGRVNDVLVKGFTSSNTTLEELGQAFSYAASSAAGAKMSVEEVTAILGVFASGGIKATRAGTGLEAMLRQMTKITPRAQKELDKLGLAFADSEGNLRPMPDIIRDLDKRLSTIPGTAERLRILQVIFGQQGARGIGALLRAGADDLERLTAELEKSGGKAEEIARLQMATLKGSFTELKSAVEGLMISIGQKLAPALEVLVEGLTKVVRWMNNLPGPLKTVAVAVLGIVGVLAGLAAAVILVLGPLGLLISGLGTFVPVLGIVTGAFGALASVIFGTVIPAIGALLVAIGPIGWAILAISAVVAVFALAWAKNWFGIREKVKGAVGFIVSFIRDNWKKIASIMAFFVGGPLAAFGVAWATNAFGIRERVAGLVEGVRDRFNTLAGWLASVWAGIRDTIMSVVGSIVQFIRDHWQEIATTFSMFAGGPLAALGVAFATNASGIRETVGNLVNSIRQWFSDMASNAFEAGKRILLGLLDGIKASVGAVVDGVRDVGGSIFEAMKSGMGVLWPFSPSEAGIKVGEGLVQGIVSGVAKVLPDLDRELGGLERRVSIQPTPAMAMASGRMLVIHGSLVTINNPVVRSDDDIRRIGEVAADQARRAVVGAL